MREYKIRGIVLEIAKGNIISQPDLDVVVNAANSELRIGGGVAGAIHKAAGPELEKACRPLAPISPGEAVITEGYNLDNDYIIHTLGPVYGVDKPESELLAECYKNSLRLADDNKLKSIGFPAISTGAFAFPMKEAAEISLKTVKNKAEELKSIKLIRFVLFNERDYDKYIETAEKIFDDLDK
jgi:O-acetyl-ADP-ribose deacetylase (regulator of RNase III)